jgi:hypothetical protein
VAETAVLVVWFSLSRLMKSARSSGVIVTTMIVWFFLYSSASDLTYTVLHSLFSFGIKQRYFLLLWIALLPVLFFFFSGKKKLGNRSFSIFLNVTMLVLVIFSLAQVSWNKAAVLTSEAPEQKSIPAAGTDIYSGNERDIYFLVLDAYARADILRDFFGFDNRPFLDSLKRRGFFVCTKSRSNYPYTELSIRSSLNMRYLGDTENVDKVYYAQDNAVANHLRPRGYTVVSVTAGTKGIKDADVYINTDRHHDMSLQFFGALLQLSILKHAIVYLGIDLPFSGWRQQVSEAFGNLADISRKPYKKFVYMHIVCPHHPFIFRPDGKPVSLIQSLTLGRPALYTGQIEYMNTCALRAVDGILANASRPPVIILAADHGNEEIAPASIFDTSFIRQRFSNLTTVFLPGHDSCIVYDSITPVNIFRRIINTYTDGNFPPLPDESIMTRYAREPFGFVNVSGMLK